MRGIRVFVKLFLAALFIVFGLITAGNKAMAGDFDPAYYAARYPDVTAALGTDSSALLKHYLQFGAAEGRFKNAAEEASGVITPLEPATYIDVDIANQSMVYYQYGVPVLSSAIVSGNTRNGNDTPTGTFLIESKIPGKYLTGPTWHVWVDRWMRFTGLVGFHDATWRSKFGGEIYKTDGSHGCVNLPHDVALQLYDMADIGTVVVVH